MKTLEELNRLHQLHQRAETVYRSSQSDDDWEVVIHAGEEMEQYRVRLEYEAGRRVWFSESLQAYEFKTD
jgi:hypothetical protein